MMTKRVGWHGKQQGQAMTEFAIVAAAVLVPLFLILPVLAKYGQVGQKSVEMARYATWERSVWHEQGVVPHGADGSALPEKTSTEIEVETKLRSLSAPDALITSGGTALSASTLDPYLHDMNGKSLVNISGVQVNLPGPERSPGWGYSFLGETLDKIQMIYDFIKPILGNDIPQFTMNTEGFYVSDDPIVRIPLMNVDYVVPLNQESGGATEQTIENVTLVMEANGGLLVDSWSAQGPAMFKTKTRGLVPSSLLQNGVFDTIRDIGGTVLLEDKLKQPPRGSARGMDIGGYNTDRFNIGVDDESLCNGDGVCSFNGNTNFDNVNNEAF